MWNWECGMGRSGRCNSECGIKRSSGGLGEEVKR